jgi:4-aminobutyrate aminotransferase-like enzyme
MSHTMTRRDVVKSMTGVAMGAWLTAWPTKIRAAASIDPKINVKVSPPGPKCLALLDRTKKSLGRTNYAGLYSISHGNGSGVYIQDLDGNVYLDCLAAASSNCLGYSHDEVAQAYFDVATKMQHTCVAYSTNEQCVRLAETLNRLMPGNFQKKTLIGLAGSDSNDGAIEAARKYTGKLGMISFRHAYHGSTGLSQAASGYPALNAGIYPSTDSNFIKMDFPITANDRDRVLRNIESVLAFGQVGAVMVECIQGDGGNLMPAKDFFPQLREMLDKYGALLICDEVQSGMGRTGKWWSYMYEGIMPDMMTCAKGLSGGYAPISTLTGRAEVLDSLDPVQHLLTYTGHPPSSAVACKVIEIIERDGLIENARKVGDRLLAGLKDMEKKYPDVVVEARGRGLQLGIEINISKHRYAGKIFAFRCVEKGLYPGYFGDKQRVIRIHPPLILSESQADIIIKTCHEVADEMQRGLIPNSTEQKVYKYALGW